MSFAGFATSTNTVQRTGRLRLSVDGRGQETLQPARSPFVARRTCTMRHCGLRTRGRWSCGGPTNREDYRPASIVAQLRRSVRVGVSVYTRSPCGGRGIGTFFDDCRRGQGPEDVIAARSPALYHSASFNRWLGPQHPGCTSGGKYVGSTDFEVCPWCAPRLGPSVSCRDVCLRRFGNRSNLSMDAGAIDQYTTKNPYDRFPDGRPKVPDEMLNG